MDLRKTQDLKDGGEIMFHVDVDKLLGKITERRFTLSSLSDQIGVSRNTLSSYIKNPEKIPYDTINKIVAVLNLNQEESVAIFFAS